MTYNKTGFTTWKPAYYNQVHKRIVSAEDLARIKAFQLANGIHEHGGKSLRVGGSRRKITLPKLKCLEEPEQ